METLATLATLNGREPIEGVAAGDGAAALVAGGREASDHVTGVRGIHVFLLLRGRGNVQITPGWPGTAMGAPAG